MQLHELLVQMRQQNGWSQQAAATKARCSLRSLQIWEKDEGVPSARHCRGLAEAYGLSPALVMTLATSAEIRRLEE